MAKPEKGLVRTTIDAPKTLRRWQIEESAVRSLFGFILWLFPLTGCFGIHWLYLSRRLRSRPFLVHNLGRCVLLCLFHLLFWFFRLFVSSSHTFLHEPGFLPYNSGVDYPDCPLNITDIPPNTAFFDPLSFSCYTDSVKVLLAIHLVFGVLTLICWVLDGLSIFPVVALTVFYFHENVAKRFYPTTELVLGRRRFPPSIIRQHINASKERNQSNDDVPDSSSSSPSPSSRITYEHPTSLHIGDFCYSCLSHTIFILRILITSLILSLYLTLLSTLLISISSSSTLSGPWQSSIVLIVSLTSLLLGALLGLSWWAIRTQQEEKKVFEVEARDESIEYVPMLSRVEGGEEEEESEDSDFPPVEALTIPSPTVVDVDVRWEREREREGEGEGEEMGMGGDQEVVVL